MTLTANRNGVWARKRAVTGAEFGHRFERGEPGLVQHQPQRGGDRRGDDRRRQHARHAARGQRRRAADVPRRQADERVDQQRRQHLHERLGPGQPLPREHRALEHADGAPERQVAAEALEPGEDRVHQCVALDLDAAHQDQPAQHQTRRGPGRRCSRRHPAAAAAACPRPRPSPARSA